MDPEQAAGQISRREERRETSWIAMIRLPDGTEIPTTVKDVSPSGARLTLPSSYTLPERFVFKVLGRDFICGVQLAWRRGDYVGVHIERVGKLGVAQIHKAASSDEMTTIWGARRIRFSQR